MGGGGLTAAGILVLLLALIGLAVGLYYVYICLRARPVRQRQHVDCEDGPLIVADQDVNGNHEDVPVEASAPVDDDTDAKKKLLSDDTDQGKVLPSELNGPLDSTPNGLTKEREAVLVPIEEKPEPAKLTHENETPPVVNNVAPVGFTAPIGFVVPTDEIPKEAVPVQPQTPKKVECAKQERAEPPIHHPVDSPVPILVLAPIVVGKKPVTDSDEEDGLLLQKCAPQDDSLDKEPYLESATDPSQEIPLHKVPASAASNQIGSPAKTSEITDSQPEGVPSNAEVEEPNAKALATSEDITDDSQPPKEPVDAVSVAVVPDFAQKPVEPCQEDNQDPPTSEGSKEGSQPMLMKEDVENLQPVQRDSNSPEAITDEDIEQLIRAIETAQDSASETIAPVLTEEIETCPGSVSEADVPVLAEEIPEVKEIPFVKVDVPVATEYPEVVYLETCPPNSTGEEAEVKDVSDEDLLAKEEPSSEGAKHPKERDADMQEEISSRSVEVIPDLAMDSRPQITITSDDSFSETSDDESVEDSRENIFEKAKERSEEIPEVVVTPGTPEATLPEVVVTPGTPEATLPEVVVTPGTPEATLPEVVVTPDTPEPKLPEVVVTPDTPEVTLPESQSESKVDIVVPDTSVNVPLSSVHSECEVPPDVPLEAEGSYYSDSMDEGNMLEVIKEEGSLVTESDGSDTESSEPEVTHYTFESGSLVPSTSSVLADEISTTLEPQVTKISVISEIEVSDHESESKEEEVKNVKPVVVISEEREASKPDAEIIPPSKEETPVKDNENANIDGSNAEISATDSEGEEAAPDMKEEIVAVPTVPSIAPTTPQVGESTTHEAEATDSEVSETESEEDETESEGEEEAKKEVFVKPPVPENDSIVVASPGDVLVTSTPIVKAEHPKVCDGEPVKNCSEPIPQINMLSAADRSNFSSVSSLSSSPSASDLSDEESTPPTTKQSRIPKLIERHGS